MSKRNPFQFRDHVDDLRDRLRELNWPESGVEAVIRDGADYAEYGRFLVRHFLKRKAPKPRGPRINRQAPRKPIPAGIKAAVWEKTDGHCFYCGVKLNPFATWTIDHVTPVAKGGADTIDNLVPACRPCNCSKGAR